MKKVIVWLVTIVVMIGVVLGSIYWYNSSVNNVIDNPNNDSNSENIYINSVNENEDDDLKYINKIQENISKLEEGKTFDTTLTEEIYGKELAEFKPIVEAEEISGSIITDEKNFVKIIPMTDFLDNQNYYFEDGKLVAYKREFMGIGGEVAYYFRDGECIFIDKTKIEEEMTYESENINNILQRASNVYEKFCKK